MYLDSVLSLGAPEFEDRADAGRRLARDLKQRGVRAGIVLGLTRGGVPIAAAIARELGVPLDVIVVKKVGTAFNSELAVGAVCADGSVVMNDDLLRQLRLSRSQVEWLVQGKLAEARAAEARYRRGRPPADLRGKAVIIADDGIATGATVRAAVTSAKNRGAAETIVAAPVVSPESVHRLSETAGRVISLLEPGDFYAVGQFYEDFSQVSDEEVERLIAENRDARVG